MCATAQIITNSRKLCTRDLLPSNIVRVNLCISSLQYITSLTYYRYLSSWFFKYAVDLGHAKFACYVCKKICSVLDSFPEKLHKWMYRSLPIDELFLSFCINEILIILIKIKT